MKLRHLLATAVSIAAVTSSANAKPIKIAYYTDLRGGYETPTISIDQTYKIGNSYSGGIEAGAGVDITPRLNFSVFANYDFAKSYSSSQDGYYLGSEGNIAYGAKIDYMLFRRGRIYIKFGGDHFTLRAKSPTESAAIGMDGSIIAVGSTFYLNKHFYIGSEVSKANLGKFANFGFNRQHTALILGYRF